MIHALTFSAIGEHTTNEDALLIERPAHDLEGYLCALADGQGGRVGGRQAAQLACEVTLQEAQRLTKPTLMTPTQWVTLLAQADHQVAASKEAGFTTLIGFYLSTNLLIGASSGDSAVWVRMGDALLDVTEHQHKNPPIGSGGARLVPFVTRLKPPWSVLAMSDGVWKHIPYARLSEATATLHGQSLIDKLQELARLSSGRFPDDFTLALLEGGT